MSRHQRLYRPELDVLRCLAFFLVFLTHSSIFPSGLLADMRYAGAFGVCLFFFLSAFLITDLLDRELESTGTVRLGAFYARRILRIWPLYFAVLLADFGFMQLHHPGTFTISHLAAFSLLAGNWFVAHHGWIGALSVPLWSISIEEQFYLLWPSVRRHASRIGSLLFSLGALVASYGAIVFLCQRGINLEIALWVNSFVQFQFFATGAALALLLRGRTPPFATWQRLALLVAGLSALFSAQAIFHIKSGAPAATVANVVPGYVLVNAGCVLIFLSFLGVSALGRARPLLYLGKISYGLYAFHWGMLNFCGNVLDRLQLRIPQLAPYNLPLRAIVSLGLTIALAAASYRYFEKPILRFKQQFEVVRTRPV